MIEILVGTLGAGKTYSAVDRWIAPKLGRGGTVSTNIVLNWEGLAKLCAQRYNVQIDPEQFVDLLGKDISEFHALTPSGTSEENSLIVLDESQLDFNSRDWSKTSRDLLAFLTQSRKENTDVIFISQAAENIDKQFRRLAEFFWTFRDMSRWTVPGLGVSFPALVKFFTLGANAGQYILACKWDKDGKTLLEKHWVPKDQGVFGAYNTKALVKAFARAGVAQRKTLNQIVTPFEKRKRMAKFILIAIIAGIIGIVGLAKSSPVSGSSPSSAAPRQTGSAPQSAGASTGSGARGLMDPERRKGAYDIYAQKFVGWDGEALRTDQGWFKVGEMSALGFVVACNQRVARIEQPDGRTGWVVAQELVARKLEPDQPVKRIEPEPVKKPVVFEEVQPRDRPAPIAIAGSPVSPALDMRRVRAGLPPAGDSRMQNIQAGLSQDGQ